MNDLLNKLSTGVLGRPPALILASLVVIGAGFLVQVALPYDTYRFNGSGPDHASTNPLVLVGQEVYMQQGCQYCHTQNMRPFEWELQRVLSGTRDKYGYFPLPTAAEYRFQSPALLGSRRVGPDLSRLAGKYTDEQMTGLLKTKRVSTLRAALHHYGYLFQDDQELTNVDALFLSWKIRGMLQANVPFSDSYQKSAFDMVAGKTRGEALVAYLLSLGHNKMEFAGKYYKGN